MHRTRVYGSRGGASGVGRHTLIRLSNLAFRIRRGHPLAAEEGPSPHSALVSCLWLERPQRLPSSCRHHRMAAGGNRLAQQTILKHRSLPSCVPLWAGVTPVPSIAEVALMTVRVPVANQLGSTAPGSLQAGLQRLQKTWCDTKWVIRAYQEGGVQRLGVDKQTGRTVLV